MGQLESLIWFGCHNIQNLRIIERINGRSLVIILDVLQCVKGVNVNIYEQAGAGKVSVFNERRCCESSGSV